MRPPQGDYRHLHIGHSDLHTSHYLVPQSDIRNVAVRDDAVPLSHDARNYGRCGTSVGRLRDRLINFN